ncbi:MAG: phosphoenolpyruvate carboxylase, partial [Caulobacteraceae bacterium]
MKSAPSELRAKVRFLGKVLGDVIKSQDGEGLFNRIEDIRQTSVAFHREGGAANAALLEERLRSLDLNETVRFAHSFACFLQITNIAEDSIQRDKMRAGDARPDTLASSLA